MTPEQQTLLLTMMKTDIGIKGTTAYDTRFTQILAYSVEKIQEEGATINLASVEDQQLTVMYACWIWRRRDNGEGMPRMLRYSLNNRILKEKVNG